MGLVTGGIPQEIVAELAALSGARTFVETGTFQGNTTRWAAGVFNTVHTIELSPSLYEQHHAALAGLPGVHPHLGDSASLLPRIVSRLPAAPAVFWLDGHWSGGETAGEDCECPVLRELQCLQDRHQDLILIDDARLFLCAPPKPHRPQQWPTIAEIVCMFPGTSRFIQIIHDVIFIVPNTESIKQPLIAYAQASHALPRPGGNTPHFRKLAKRWLGH